MDTHTHLREIRDRRGISAAALAKLAGVTRQTIYAIEAGDYVPNTAVALHLARILEVRVEELFSLDAEPVEDKSVTVEFLTPAHQGQPVQICRVGNRMIGVSASPQSIMLPQADAIAIDQTQAQMLPGEEEDPKRLLIAGCDPGISLLAPQLDLIPAAANSRQALEWLKQGKVHVAGTHLRDVASGEYNLAAIRQLFPHGSVKVVTFAIWEQGLVTRPSSPIRGVEDLVNFRIVNREKGAGSRDVLDQRLRAAGIAHSRITGYDRIASGHLPAAQAVQEGEADCCIATRSAARAFGLQFIPLAVERYDLVVRRAFATLPPVEMLFDLLNRSALRRKLEMLAGYDTSHTGAVLVA
ncbi:MAG TPA: substrate-binding domain-containing protein [Bryobacteraceae bacterium]|nr:substrate-binding domain-containing protein [Bryobacteraceae bacterium]